MSASCRIAWRHWRANRHKLVLISQQVRQIAAFHVALILMITRCLILKVLVHLSRFGLAALFLFTAGAKLFIFSDFVSKVSELLVSSGFDGKRWALMATVGVIAAEVIAAVLLILPRTVRAGGLWSAGLLVFFAGFALYYVYVLKGEALECGCFGGVIASQFGVSTALRKYALLIPAA